MVTEERLFMHEYKKNIKKIVMIMVISIITGVVIMVGYAGIHYMKAGDNKGKHAISNENILVKGDIKEKNGKYYVSKDGGELIIKVPKQYINKFSYEYKSSFFSNSRVFIKKDNIYGVSKEIEKKDEYMQDMPRTVVNIDGKVSKIEIQFEQSYNELEIYNFSVDNSLKVNPLLGGFVSSVVFIFSFLYVFRNENKRHPEIAFFVCAFISGICLLILQPPYITGWDEQIHFKYAYMLGCTKENEPATQALDYYYGNAYMLNTVTQGTPESIEEKLDYIRVLNDKNRYSGVVADDYKMAVNSAGYVFQALFLRVGKILNAPFYVMWIMGRFANLLLYTIIMSLAVRIVPIGKRLLMVLGLLPIMIFQSTVYTYDVCVIAFLTLGSCILIKEIIRKDEKFRYRWRIAFIVCVVLGCLPKAVYFPLILGGLLLGKDKFYSKKDEWIFKGIIILTVIGLLSSFLLPYLSAPEQSSDSRGGETNGGLQLTYILKQPFAYAIVLLKNVIGTFQDSIMGTYVLTSFSYLGNGTFSIVSAMLLGGVTLTDTYGDKISGNRTLDVKTRIIFGTEIMITIAFIWTALYISFTEVAEEVIQGVQARYYLPFLFLLYLCFQNKKIENNISLERYQLCVMMISNGILFQQIYQLVLLQKCM